MYPIEVLEKNESKKLYQWDTERYVLITAPKGIEVDAVDFAHEKDLQAVRKKIVIENGTLKAKIPNALLQSNEKIRAWLMCGEQTVYSRGLVVLPKSKSPDYVLPDDEDEVRSYISLEKRIAELEKIIKNDEFGLGGKTAYQYAKDGGYTGTEEEFAQKMAEENPTKEEFDKLSEDIDDLKNNQPTSGSGVTTAQSNSLWAIIQKSAFAEVLTDAELNAFKTAWGIESGGEVEPDVPDEPIEPDNPEVTLTSISATYTGGEVAVGTSVNSLTGITVKATYSDGSTKTVTGYALSGTIAEGINTITVSYSGKTTTFTVTGVAESSGDDTNEFVNLFNANLRKTTPEDVNSGIGSYTGNYVNTDADIQLTGGVTYYAYSLFNGQTYSLTVFENNGDGTYTNSGLNVTKKCSWLYNNINSDNFKVEIDGTSYYLCQMSFTPTEDCAVRFAFNNKCVGHTYPDYNYLFTKEYNPHLDSLS